MTTRRKFIKKSLLASAAIPLAGKAAAFNVPSASNSEIIKPIVISTWNHGMDANKAAWKVLSGNGRALDAVEQGVRVSESDPNVNSVGYGGVPDREGNVTLDACIMDEKGNCGSVAFLANIMNPISVARLVMEKTPHIMLAGQGALEFALDNGFKKQDLLTDEMRAKWEQWKAKGGSKQLPVNKDNHDTIGMITLDASGNVAGACTTSGLSWKYHGRVGDSPIIGAGMYADNEVGGACATGKGEAVIKMAGSFLVVELMRNGVDPQEACSMAINRIIRYQPDHKSFQVGFLALNKKGQTGACSLRKGFEYAVHTAEGNKLKQADYALK